MEKPKTDGELLERLREKHPKMLEAEMDFDLAIMRVLTSRQKEEKKVSTFDKTKVRKKLKRRVS